MRRVSLSLGRCSNCQREERTHARAMSAIVPPETEQPDQRRATYLPVLQQIDQLYSVDGEDPTRCPDGRHAR